MRKQTYRYNVIIDADGHEVVWNCRSHNIKSAKLMVEAETGFPVKSIHRAAPETRRPRYVPSMAWVDMGQAATY